jgi:hypothetical protein
MLNVLLPNREVQYYIPEIPNLLPEVYNETYGEVVNEIKGTLRTIDYGLPRRIQSNKLKDVNSLSNFYLYWPIPLLVIVGMLVFF